MVFANFGSDVPFAEPQWYRGCPSPFYNESHVQLRNKMRKFIDENFTPFIDDWEEKHLTSGFEIDAKVIAKKAVSLGLYAPMVDKEHGGTPLENSVPFDSFHDLIWIDELSRCGSSGAIPALTMWTMSLPPVLTYGSAFLQNEVVKPVLKGDKMLSLCVSEPLAGSDVSRIRTTAEFHPSKAGKEGFFVINGQKKWITWAIHADFFTVACKVNRKFSIIVVPRNLPGVTVKRMKLQGNWTAGTSYVTFEDVKVPEKYLVGKIGDGFKIILTNFNHERFVISIQAIRMCRICIEESIEFARKRETFGNRLIDSQVIRHKIAEMARATENCFALAESMAFQMDELKKNPGGKEAMSRYSANMALLKVSSSKALELCARESSQILGGSSYTREGKGVKIERIYREVRSYAIPGGSEEILLDYAMKASKL